MNLTSEINLLLEALAKDEKAVVQALLADLKDSNDFLQDDDVVISGRFDPEGQDFDDIEIDKVSVSKFSDYLHDIMLDVLPKEKVDDIQSKDMADNIHKFLKNVETPFVAALDDDFFFSGVIKILKTRYNKKDDVLHVLNFKLVSGLDLE